MDQRATVNGVSGVVALIDKIPRLEGRAQFLWFLVLGGLFLDAYSNAALGAGLAPMTKQMGLSPTQVAIITATAPALAIIFNPVGGWLATRIGRVPPLLIAKVFAFAGALIVCFAAGFEQVLLGRVFVGIAYGVDFAVAMALLAEYTPKKFSGRLNFWQAVWYIATTTNLALALLFYHLDVGAAIWRWSVGSAAVFAAVLFGLQSVFLVESPSWLAAKGRLEQATKNLKRIYGIEAVPGAVAEQEQVRKTVGFKQIGLLFQGKYLPRTMISSVISLNQAMQYFAIGWYLPIIALSIFGQDFRQATLGSMIFNVFGILGGLMSAYVGRRLGLRMSSALGFGVVFIVLLVMGLTFGKIPVAVAAILPALFIFFHSVGPGANGKSIAALSYRSEVRSLGTGVTGMIGSFGSVIGLYLFPIVKDAVGLETTFMILSVVPLSGLIVCLLIKWDPLQSPVPPDEERGLPGTFDERLTPEEESSHATKTGVTQ